MLFKNPIIAATLTERENNTAFEENNYIISKLNKFARLKQTSGDSDDTIKKYIDKHLSLAASNNTHSSLVGSKNQRKPNQATLKLNRQLRSHLNKKRFLLSSKCQSSNTNCMIDSKFFQGTELI